MRKIVFALGMTTCLESMEFVNAKSYVVDPLFAGFSSTLSRRSLLPLKQNLSSPQNGVLPMDVSSGLQKKPNVATPFTPRKLSNLEIFVQNWHIICEKLKRSTSESAPPKKSLKRKILQLQKRRTLSPMRRKNFELLVLRKRKTLPFLPTSPHSLRSPVVMRSPLRIARPALGEKRNEPQQPNKKWKEITRTLLIGLHRQ